MQPLTISWGSQEVSLNTYSALENTGLTAMDLQAYSWACGSSIRCLETEGREPEDATRGDVLLTAQGLVSVWAAAVQVAADLGDVEDVEEELGPYAAAIASASKLASQNRQGEGEGEEGAEAAEATDMRAVEDVEAARGPPYQEASCAEVQAPMLALEPREKAPEGEDKLDGFLGLLSAWSDDAPASRLLEEARLSKAGIARKSSPRRAPELRGGKAKPLSKESLDKLRERFPHSRAPSPPADTRHWRRQDFELYFGPALSH